MLGNIILTRYQAVRLLGEGGMGQVFLGRQLHPPREVVIKVMHDRIAQTPRFRQTFQHEITLLAQLHHPAIVQLLEAGVDEQHGPCLVMEYLPGVTLESLRRRLRRFEPERVGRWLVQLCSALQYAHELGVVHRDLKPENLMVLDADMPSERIKVLDFGLAQLSATPHIALEKLKGTSRHIGGGTPDYLPPEQVRGDGVDRRGDIYSVGVMLFQLLTGRLPFTGQDGADVLLAHVEKPPPRFSEAAPAHQAPPAVEAVVQACLAKYPNERPQSARELAERYEKALGERLIDANQFAAPASSAADTSPAPAAAAEQDPHTVVHHLEAWMPESIAVVKLRGFAEDGGGQVVESEPGLIRLRFPDPAPPAPRRSGVWSWLGGTTPPATVPTTAMELRMRKQATERQSVLQLTVLLRPEGDPGRVKDPQWAALADQRFRDLRAYLMGKG